MDKVEITKYSISHVPFYFLRHGQTDWNVERRGQGRTDIPLNETGIAQAYAAKELLRECGIKTIVSSPLSRASRTAEIVNEAYDLPLQFVDELQEASFGEYEGVIAGDWFSDWFDGITPRGAEPYEEFLQRGLIGLNKALEFSGPVLVVAHGGIYWSIQRFAELGEGRVIKNCDPIYHEPRLHVDKGISWHATKLADES